MVGENPRARHPPASRATLPAIGHAATLAATSAARTAGGESQTHHHCQAKTDSLPGTDSFCVSGSADSDSASFSQQAPAVDLQRTGVGNSRQRGIPLRKRPSATAQETGLDSWFE